MDSSFQFAYRAARRQYELGRLRDAAMRAAVLVLLAAALTSALVGRSALVWLPLMFGVSVLMEWLGRFWMKGARRGFAAGLVALVVPLSILRPCCAADRMASLSGACCTMPSICWATGGALGLALSLMLPKEATGHRWQTALAMLVGVTSVTIVRCSALFFAEAAGLLGGLLAGVVAASFARALLDRTRVAA